MEIPRRKITETSVELLQTTINSVLKEMLDQSCPCHYPRFIELTSFLHDNYNAGAVFCCDTNYLISIATNKKLNYLMEVERKSDSLLGDFDDSIYRCNICATKFRKVTRQYNIHFIFSYFLLEERKFGYAIGAKVEKPIPLLQGLFGFNDEDILKCAIDFNLSGPEEFYAYLTKKADKL